MTRVIRSLRPAPLPLRSRRLPRSGPRARAARPGSRIAALLAAALFVSMLSAAIAPSAEATPRTLRRSFANMLNGPFDMVLAPFSGGMTLARNLQEIDDTPGVRLAYSVPGWVWLTGLNFGSGGIRIVTGVLEFLPGVGLFYFDSDVDTLFDPVDDATGMYEWWNPLEYNENPLIAKNPLATPFTIPVKVGINYTSAGF